MNKPISLADLSDSPYLASDDFAVGAVLPAVVIERIEMKAVPIPNSNKTNSKAIAFFRGASKGWCINKTVAREMAKAANLPTKNIGETWVGVTVQLKVVGDVRRPDGTRGNAFRLSGVWPPGQTPPTAAQKSDAIDAAKP